MDPTGKPLRTQELMVLGSKVGNCTKTRVTARRFRENLEESSESVCVDPAILHIVPLVVTNSQRKRTYKQSSLNKSEYLCSTSRKDNLAIE